MRLEPASQQAGGQDAQEGEARARAVLPVVDCSRIALGAVVGWWVVESSPHLLRQWVVSCGDGWWCMGRCMVCVPVSGRGKWREGRKLGRKGGGMESADVRMSGGWVRPRILRRYAASSAPSGRGDYCGKAAGLSMHQASCSVKTKSKIVFCVP